MAGKNQELIDSIKAEVGNLRTVRESVVALIDRLIAAVNEVADDPAELSAVLADITAERNALAAKVTENTPNA